MESSVTVSQLGEMRALMADGQPRTSRKIAEILYLDIETAHKNVYTLRKSGYLVETAPGSKEWVAAAPAPNPEPAKQPAPRLASKPVTQPAPAAQAQPEAPATPAPAAEHAPAAEVTTKTRPPAPPRPPKRTPAERTLAQVRRMTRTASYLSRLARGTPLEPDARLLGEQLAHLHTLIGMETV